MKKSIVACMRLDENNIHLTVVNTASSEIIKSELLTPDFEVLENSGSVAHPTKLSVFIQETVGSLNLASSVKVSISLKYLELKRLTLPQMPEAELTQVVRDEAIRESIFSYTGDPIAVTHMIIGQPKAGTDLAILAAIIPQEIIDGIMDVFKNTSLKLTSIQPSLIGLEHVIADLSPNSGGPSTVLLIDEGNTELYVFENSSPLFWRFLSVGSEEPERLMSEVSASIEHYQSRSAQARSITEVLLVGPKTKLDLGPAIKVESLSLEERADLWGLGLSRKSEKHLQFLASPSSWGNRTPVNILFPLSLILLLLVNMFIGWRLLNGFHRVTRVQASIARQNQTLTSKQQLLAGLKRNDTDIPGSSRFIDNSTLLNQLRAIVPANLRFENISLNYSLGMLAINGICLDPANLDRFLQRLSEVEGIRSADLVASNREDRSGLTVYSFKINMVLEVLPREQSK